MREIKFRGKGQGHWYSGYYYEECENTYIIDDRNNYDICKRNMYHKVNKETVGQFTGKCDKNGKEIYEGDILRFYDEPYYISEVCYSDDSSAFMIEEYPSSGNLEYLGGQDTLCSIIIGNIYDNPELIKEE